MLDRFTERQFKFNIGWDMSKRCNHLGYNLFDSTDTSEVRIKTNDIDNIPYRTTSSSSIKIQKYTNFD